MITWLQRLGEVAFLIQWTVTLADHLAQELRRCQLARWGARLGNRKESKSSLDSLSHSLACARSLAHTGGFLI